MIVDYSHDSGSLRRGVAQTFGGEHPCELCRQISTGMQKEKRDDRQQTRRDERSGKIPLLAVLPTIGCSPFVQQERHLPPHAPESGGRLAEAPPGPPPRMG